MTIHSLKFAWTKINLNLITTIAIAFVISAGIIAAINLYNIAVSHKEIPTKLIVWGNDARTRIEFDGSHHYLFSDNTGLLFRTRSQSSHQAEQ